MMVHRIFRLLLTAALAMTVQAALEATMFVPTSFQDLVTDARTIVHGRVIDVRGEYAGEPRRIVTMVTLQAAQYFKGATSGEVQFLVPGGTLGRYRTIVVGAPSFRAGEEVVVFLNAQGAALPYVLGL